MTGRELIIYILSNNLEDEKIPWFISETEAAEKFDVGVYTIRMWHKVGMLDGFELGDKVYILKNAEVKR